MTLLLAVISIIIVIVTLISLYKLGEVHGRMQAFEEVRVILANIKEDE